MKKKFQPHLKPFVLITIFIVLMIVGIAVGEPGRVLEQAKAICLSCIGIGERPMEMIRKLIQTLSIFLMNGFWGFPLTRNIYQGPQQTCNKMFINLS